MSSNRGLHFNNFESCSYLNQFDQKDDFFCRQYVFPLNRISSTVQTTKKSWEHGKKKVVTTKDRAVKSCQSMTHRKNNDVG